MDAVRRKTIQDAMVRLSDGDRTAMGPLVQELWPVILSFAKRGLRQVEGAEDVAQEVFLKICSRISDFDRRRDGVSWAFAIASYEVMTARRRHHRRRETVVDVDRALGSVADTAPSQEESALQSELNALVLEVAGALSDADRATLGLLEATEPDAANNPTLRKRKQRALERFRTVWRRLHGDA
jgi:RNA polymerase sigma-70 factor (ECF subfamily)